MKTSNKILLGLLVIVFTVPFLMAYSLKSKMKKGDYTIQKNENTSGGSMRQGSFTAFKVVKVSAPSPELLNCHLKLSDEMNYKYYNNDSKDSVMVFTSNDTLYINYVGDRNTNQNERRNYRNYEVNVNLPAFNNIIVDGAVVIIDSFPALENLSITLKNNGEIKDGSENKKEEGAGVSPAKNIEKEGSEAPETPKTEVTIESKTRKLETIQKVSAESVNPYDEDFLRYGLLLGI